MTSSQAIAQPGIAADRRRPRYRRLTERVVSVQAGISNDCLLKSIAFSGGGWARVYPKWTGWLAIAGGVPTIVAGVVMAYTGFSGTAMAINMPASSILLAWMFTLGVLMWRRPWLGADETAV